MSEMRKYPKRLIEVDLPIRKISAFSRAEKSVRQGHISTLHVWWARRPLAACRAVIAASLWLDPADEFAPTSYREAVLDALREFAQKALTDRGSRELLAGSYRQWTDLAEGRVPEDPRDGQWLRTTLLDMVAMISSWPASVDRAVLRFAESVTLASQNASGGTTKRPLVFDPFAGGGAMPLEALRVGADAFASDLNPVAVLLNRVVLELAPGQQDELASKVRRLGAELGASVRKQLADLYPSDPDGSKPIAYIWARTIRCEGPACGKAVPLTRSFWLTKRSSGSAGVQMKLLQDAKTPTFVVSMNARTDQVSKPTVKKGAAVCPWCDHTTPVERVRAQLSEGAGGAANATLLAVVVERPSGGRGYRAPDARDIVAVDKARERLAVIRRSSPELLPDEALPPKGTLGFRVQNYGVSRFEHLFSPRQLVTLVAITEGLRSLEARAIGEAESVSLSLALGRMQDLNNSFCRWADTVVGANAGQNRLSMTWDFAEAAPLAGAGGGWDGQVEWIAKVLEHIGNAVSRRGTVTQAPAQRHPLPDDSAALLATDPPYYDAFGYSDLADLFFVWLKRATTRPHVRFAEYGADGKTPKALEIVVNPGASSDGRGPKDHDWFYSQMCEAFAEARRVVAPGGIGVIVFAHKDTRSWEALLSGVIDAGWVVTASWPIDTERPTRQRAIGSAALASSVHLVCRPRETSDGMLATDRVGDWREVLRELPTRIHEWLPRLAHEGVVGADAIFSCLGPGLEIFSRYSRVEKVSGEVVPLREYLEHVWAAVSREALSMIFEDPETAGLEGDARITAMWLWTLAAPSPELGDTEETEDPDDESEDEEGQLASTSTGFGLDFDAARKIAQGLGAKLDELSHVVEVKGDKARLLAVVERTKYLFGKAEGTPTARKATKRKQMTLFAELQEAAEAHGWGDGGAPKAGTTTLDRVHQAMLLFGSGRGEGLKRFIVEEGVGKQPQFWKLAQSLSALYPNGTDEKRWVDGVLARKKGLGF